MSEQIAIRIDGKPVQVAAGTTVAVAIMQMGTTYFRTSVLGQRRGPICGMGICMECRVTINGVAHQRSCQLLVQPEMEVVTGE